MGYLFSLRALLATAILTTGTLTASVMLHTEPQAALYLEPERTTIQSGESVTVSVRVKSNVPVNAFTGEIVFNDNHFFVESIDYNTSVANLWAEEPWYNRSNNSIYFAGGTTQAGGFSGSDELLQFTLQARSEGNAGLSLRNTRILAHDGIGSDVPIREPLDTLFIIDTTPFATPVESIDTPSVIAVATKPNLDVNRDGSVNFRDIGVILTSFGSGSAAYDFNNDGSVTWQDVGAWQRLRRESSE